MLSPASGRSGTLCAVGFLLLGLVASCDLENVGPITQTPVPTAIKVTPDHPTLGQGLDLQLSAAVLDKTGHAIAGKVVTFTSTDDLVATVTSDGLLHAVGPSGAVRVIASFELVVDTFAVTITQRAMGLQVTTDSLTINRHLNAQIQLTALDFVGRPMPLSSGVTFASAAPDLATVNGFGLVSALGKNGRTTVTITANTAQVVVPVTVAQIPGSLTIGPATLMLATGESGPLTTTVLDQHFDPIASPALAFRSNASALFTVSPAGVVTSIAGPGSGTVSVTLDTLTAASAVYVGGFTPGALVRTTPMPGAYEAAIAPDGRLAVSGGASGSMSLGLLPAFTLGAPVAVGSMGVGIALDHAGTRAFVASETGVAVIDVASATHTTDFTGFGGGTRYSLAVAADNGKLFVGTKQGVYAINLATGAAVDSIPLGGPVYFIALDPVHGRLYASVDGVGVQEVNLGAAMSAGRTFNLNSPRGIGVSPDGSELYVTSDLLHNLEVWSLASGTQRQIVPMGSDPGFGLTVSANRIAVTNPAGTVRLFDRATRLLLNTITTHGEPQRPAWSADGTTLAVPNLNGWVDFIQ